MRNSLSVPTHVKVKFGMRGITQQGAVFLARVRRLLTVFSPRKVSRCGCWRVRLALEWNTEPNVLLSLCETQILTLTFWFTRRCFVALQAIREQEQEDYFVGSLRGLTRIASAAEQETQPKGKNYHFSGLKLVCHCPRFSTFTEFEMTTSSTRSGAIVLGLDLNTLS